MFVKPAGEGDGPIEDSVAIAVAEQACYGFARLPSLILFRRIL